MNLLITSYRSPKTAIRSQIGGRGLFATAPIRRGEVVSVKGEKKRCQDETKVPV
jgi:hypothetical protein